MVEPEELIKRFHNEIIRKYPNLSLEELNLICRAPFIFLRRQMARLDLPQIRFQYWGVFKVKGGRLSAMSKITEKASKSDRVSSEKIDKMKQIINLKSQNDEN